MLSIILKCPQQAVIASCYVPWMYLTILYYRPSVPSLNSDLMSCLEVIRVDLRGLCVRVRVYELLPCVWSGFGLGSGDLYKK